MAATILNDTAGKAPQQSPFAGRRIKNYHRPLDQWLWHPALRDGRFTLADVPAMQQNNAIAIGTLAIYGPILNASHEVRANSKEIKTFVENALYRFWHHDLIKVLEQYVPWGTAVAETMYEKDVDSGLWRYAGMDVFDMRDVQLWKRGRHLSRAIVSRGSGMMPMLATPGRLVEEDSRPNEITHPKVFCCAHRPHPTQLHGNSVYIASWAPWMELVGSHGALSIRKLWAFSNAFRGCWVRYPAGGSQRRQDGTVVDNQDIAREIAEAYCTGAAGAIPSEVDEHGNQLWEIIDPALNGEIRGLMEYPDGLNREIWQGMGIHDEVLSAPDVGGWLGHSNGAMSAPMLVFLNIEDMRVREITTAFDVGPSGYTTRSEQAGGVIRPLVMENFGPKAKYEIRPISLIPKAKAEPGAGGSPASAPGAATQPPSGGGGGMPGPKAPPAPKAPGGSVKLSQEDDGVDLPDEDVDAILSLSGGLFDAEAHPRGEQGRFTHKPLNAEHVKAAQKACKAGKLTVHHTSSPISSDASGERIHHHVTLESGHRIHPDELHRLRVEDGETLLHEDEGLTIHEPGGKSDAHSFADALHKVSAFSSKPDEPVTIESKHGYSATRPRSEWMLEHILADGEPGSFASWYDTEGHEHTGRRVEHDGGATLADEDDTERFFTPHSNEQGRLGFSADANGREHKGKGPGGGQFTAKEKKQDDDPFGNAEYEQYDNTPAPPKVAQDDHPAIANLIHAAGQNLHNWNGEALNHPNTYSRKVFLSDIYDAIKNDVDGDMTLTDFKKIALKMNQDGKLELRRLDMPAAVHPDSRYKIAESEIRYSPFKDESSSPATFHLAIIPQPGTKSLSLGGDDLSLSTDAKGHEHKGKGPGGGQFTSHGGGEAQPSAKGESPKDPAAQPTKPADAVSLTKKLTGKASATYHAVKSLGSKSFQKLPKSVQAATAAALTVYQAPFLAAQIIAERISIEKGSTPEEAAKTRSILAAADLVASKPVSIAGALLGVHPVATWVVPPVTACYLLHATVRHPMATMRAAGGLIKETAQLLKKKVDTHTVVLSANGPNADKMQLVRSLEKNNWDDWYTALLHVALQETKDAAEAIEVAELAFARQPQDRSRGPRADDAAALFEAKDTSLSANWDASKHPRGQAENAGEFAESGHSNTNGQLGKDQPKQNHDATFTKAAEADAFAQKHVAKPQLTNRGQAAISAYRNEDACYQINNFLRNRKSIGQKIFGLGGRNKQTIKDLDTIIAHSRTTAPMTAMRGFRILPGEPSAADQFKPGAVFTDQGFVSTTLATDVAERFSRTTHADAERVIVSIDLPEGSNAYHMPRAGGEKDEAELVLPRGARFHVQSVERDQHSGVTRVRVKYIGTEQFRPNASPESVQMSQVAEQPGRFVWLPSHLEFAAPSEAPQQ